MAKKKAKTRSDDGDKPKIPSDAYTGLLSITLVALIAGAVLFYLDQDSLAAAKTNGPSYTVKAAYNPEYTKAQAK
jgi:hypothetical protein